MIESIKIEQKDIKIHIYKTCKVSKWTRTQVPNKEYLIPNWKIHKTSRNSPDMPKIGRKPAKNGPKWTQNSPDRPEIGENQPKWPKTASKSPNMLKMGRKSSKIGKFARSVDKYMRVLWTDPRTISAISPYILRKNLRKMKSGVLILKVLRRIWLEPTPSHRTTCIIFQDAKTQIYFSDYACCKRSLSNYTLKAVSDQSREAVSAFHTSQQVCSLLAHPLRSTGSASQLEARVL